MRCFFRAGSEYLSLLDGGRLTGGGGLPLCVLVGLCPDVDEPPSELSGGVKFCGFLLYKDTNKFISFYFRSLGGLLLGTYRFRHCRSCSV